MIKYIIILYSSKTKGNISKYFQQGGRHNVYSTKYNIFDLNYIKNV